MFSTCTAQHQLTQMAFNLGQLTNMWTTARSASQASISTHHRHFKKQEHQNTEKVKVEKTKKLFTELGLTPDVIRNIAIHDITAPEVSPELVNYSCRLGQQYVSTNTFYENTTGFKEENLQKASYGSKKFDLHMLFPQFLKLEPHQVLQQARRGFKTNRSKDYAGLGAEAEDVLPSRRIIKSLSKMKSERPEEKQKGKKLSSFLSNQNVSQSEADKLKIAFAEGYSANTGEKPEKSNKLFNRLRLIATIAILIYFAKQIISSFSGIPGVKLSMSMNEGFEAVNPEDITVTFQDVKGCDEAKQELQDVVEFLKNPERFKELGAKLPKGVLLVGPPGIGKTLLARAVAGEAVVPFFHASGSEFDEMFVGTGAKRVRSLFDSAKAQAPCVIFIDEIDTVGAKRTSSTIHPYANQTINQLLTEMDGFSTNAGVIVLGATNKRSNLDSALLRPGRFDVEVRVYPPDLKGRTEILELYMEKIKYAENVSIEKLAKCTPGCTGAELENIVNQAAIKAALDGDPMVTNEHLEFALDKVLMGAEKKSKIPDKDVNWCTAYHEAGHAIVAYCTQDALPVRKVTIMPRGMSLGHTSMVPEKDRYNLTKSQLLASMDVAMGGRVAEEIIYGADKVTTGAGSDFSNATDIATSMVKHYGMSERIGVRVFSDQQSDMGMLAINTVSPNMTEMIDSEIKRLLEESYNRAKTLLKTHQRELKALATALEKYETLDDIDVKTIMEGKKLKKSISRLGKKGNDSDLKDSDGKAQNKGSSNDPGLNFLTSRK